MPFPAREPSELREHLHPAGRAPGRPAQSHEAPDLASVARDAARGSRFLTGERAHALQGAVGNHVVQRLFARGPRRSGGTPAEEGLPTGLRAGIEGLSGLSMDDVRVHYNSAEPSKVDAAAYTAHTDIHVAPGEERHLAHEAWHVVQQKQGRVREGTRVGGVPINTDHSLEHEADRMGERAGRLGVRAAREAPAPARSAAPSATPVRQLWATWKTGTDSEVKTSAPLEALVREAKLEHADAKEIKLAKGGGRLFWNVTMTTMQQYRTLVDNVEFYTAVTKAKADNILKRGKSLTRSSTLSKYFTSNVSDFMSSGYLYFGTTPEVPRIYATNSGMLGDDWVMLKFTMPEGALMQADPEWPQGVRAEIDVPSDRCQLYEDHTNRKEHVAQEKIAKREAILAARARDEL